MYIYVYRCCSFICLQHHELHTVAIVEEMHRMERDAGFQPPAHEDAYAHDAALFICSFVSFIAFCESVCWLARLSVFACGLMLRSKRVRLLILLFSPAIVRYCLYFLSLFLSVAFVCFGTHRPNDNHYHEPVDAVRIFLVDRTGATIEATAWLYVSLSQRWICSLPLRLWLSLRLLTPLCL